MEEGKTLILYPCAKVNFTMEVLDKRPDGYHLVRTVMQSVSLRDRLTIERTRERGILFTCTLPELAGEDNHVVRAFRLLEREFCLPGGIRAHLDKRIPCQSGMGGGSSDCAGALLGVVRLFDLPVSAKELAALGKQLGADVPFCLGGRPALAQGIGEKLTPLTVGPPMELVVLMPPAAFSTPEMYRRLDSRTQRPPLMDLEPLLHGLAAGDSCAVSGALCNHFEAAAPCPHLIDEAKQALLSAGAQGASMTGAGAAVFGIFSSREKADAAAFRLRRKEGFRVFRCHTLADAWSAAAQEGEEKWNME